MSFLWSLSGLPTGSHARIFDPNLPAPTFEPDLPGSYHLRLVVSNGTLTSAPAEITVQVGDCGIHAPVIASVAAEPPTAVATGQAVRLSPVFSDPDTEPACGAQLPEFSFSWRFEELPLGSAATLNDTTAIRPSFTPDVPGTYTVRVTVTDPTGRSASATVTISVDACGTNAPSATVVASALSVSPGDGVQLQGTGDDADNATPCSAGQALSYSWRLARVPAGSSAMLNDPRAEWPSFVADQPGTYVAELIVTDSTGRMSPPARVTVTADTCGTARPVAVADKTNPGGTVRCGAGAIAVDFGGTGVNRIHLDARTSSDADNTAGGCALAQTLFYRWTVLVAPWDGRWRLESPDGLTTDLDTQDNGEYRVRLLVTDSAGLTSDETICTFQVTGT